ncbi:hypothetical protein PMIN04_004425 [Paraphaeosphaeria minitans]
MKMSVVTLTLVIARQGAIPVRRARHRRPMSRAEWLEGSKAPALPDSLLHPADVFPLGTISNPSTSTDSDLE